MVFSISPASDPPGLLPLNSSAGLAGVHRAPKGHRYCCLQHDREQPEQRREAGLTSRVCSKPQLITFTQTRNLYFWKYASVWSWRRIFELVVRMWCGRAHNGETRLLTPNTRGSSPPKRDLDGSSETNLITSRFMTFQSSAKRARPRQSTGCAFPHPMVIAVKNNLEILPHLHDIFCLLVKEYAQKEQLCSVALLHVFLLVTGGQAPQPRNSKVDQVFFWGGGDSIFAQEPRAHERTNTK